MAEQIDINELRRKIDRGEIELTSETDRIETGQLINKAGKTIDYEITHGCDIISANSCDRQWGLFHFKLLEYIEKQGYSEEELESIFSGMQVEHLHWDWFKKSICYTDDGYEWFYLFADRKPQSACLIYHPKKSAFEPGDIFYIEFVAVAPWNRDNPMAKREFRGIGTLMIKSVLQFATDKLQLRPGFSLRALPQACGYYEKIGMLNVSEKDTGKLSYYELPRVKALELMEVA